VNLPNAITIARIAATPLITLLPLQGRPGLRLAAFVLFVIAAITDYWDGHLARSRNLVTDLGRMLDPLADKLLLVGTLIPMYVLMGASSLVLPLATPADARPELPFVSPIGLVALPVWVLLVVVGREAFMTLFRQLAMRRGVVISAIGPAKWKTTFQSIWVGSAYCWFFMATLAAREGWENAPAWRFYQGVNGIVGALSMVAAVALTLYSMALYLVRYGGVLRAPVAARSGSDAR
jgi:phosphatidylglycerophosphate synthase